MPSISLDQIISALDDELKTASIDDYPGAVNGLQVANEGRVTRVAVAVDAHEDILEIAVKAGADLLIVHHGLFWGKPIPLTGVMHRKIALCIKNNLAVYSSHLPLDAHPTLGNNILLTRALGFKKSKSAFEAHGTLIGRVAQVAMTREVLMERLTSIVQGHVRLIPGGTHRIKNVGIITGAGDVTQALKAGVDTFVTGEIQHHTFGWALENRINLIAAGHYNTETFGVKALGAWIEKKFRIPWQFIDLPSGI